jgi:hypothetical protein
VHATSKTARLEVVRPIKAAAKTQHFTVDVPEWEWDLSDPFVLPPAAPAVVLPVLSKSTASDALLTLRGKGIKKLYHFTDVSSLPSIQKHGLLSWVALDRMGIGGRRGSSALSRELDTKKGLGDFVRLCFTQQHPMMYSAKKDGRLAEAVVLEIDLDVVSVPGVLFSDRNAAASDAVISRSPTEIRFDLVRCSSQFAVSLTDRRFYQAEVLVPTSVSPALINPLRLASGVARPVRVRPGSVRSGSEAVVPPGSGSSAFPLRSSGSNLFEPAPIHVDTDIIHVDIDSS